jgi:hypothetical protein
MEERWRSSEARRLQTEAELADNLANVRNLRRELSALEAALFLGGGEDPTDDRKQQLPGVKVLYVGGRPKLVEQLKAHVTSRGGALLSHDGGVDDNSALLPGLISHADAVLFPVDCISHAAAEQVKKLCRRLAKPWAPLRSASLASFVAQVSGGQAVEANSFSTPPPRVGRVAQPKAAHRERLEDNV